MSSVCRWRIQIRLCGILSGNQRVEFHQRAAQRERTDEHGKRGEGAGTRIVSPTCETVRSPGSRSCE